ncbi:jg11724 [Pararge aegeria aegeria]|uniref:Jg11724 protein n=1 Tax=Pararge aegeria aegeria TaxID=348720 RepID=A0A8S4RZZ4_9NEOP|nr:jg11724 [Pararge aegeria aegeria]
MFSSLFGKRRSSPVEDDTPPIPGPKADDGFVIVDPNPPRGGLYPSFSGNQFPPRPAPAPPVARRTKTDQTFHYLQGPFIRNSVICHFSL